jgi:hypothetical protein
MSEYGLKDSGERQRFAATGGHRDTATGKGRFDLMPTGALRRVAQIYEKGAVKYDARNWEKGIPVSRMLDSAFRHLVQAIEGHQDEDHIGQACWNLLGVMEYEEWYKAGVDGVGDLWHDEKYPMSRVYFHNHPEAPKRTPKTSTVVDAPLIAGTPRVCDTGGECYNRFCATENKCQWYAGESGGPGQRTP